MSDLLRAVDELIRQGGLNTVSIYFHHATRSPGNVILAWHDMAVVPRVGDRMKGLFGDWRVAEVIWQAQNDDRCRLACVHVNVEDVPS